MTRRIEAGPAATLAYEVRGDGIPLLAFHGAYSARSEVREFLEPMLEGQPLRRIYVDLPGHGQSRPSSGVRTPDAVLDLVDRLLEVETDGGRFLVLGHSYGGHFARALAARHPDRVAGLALLCPFVAGEQRTAEAVVVRDDGVSEGLDAPERAAYEEYFVVRTAQTLERFRRAVAPAAGEVDGETVEVAIAAGPHAVDPDAVAIEVPVIVISARHDRWVGWRRQERLGERYPRATTVTVGDAGHALPHERPGIVAALLTDWIAQIDL